MERQILLTSCPSGFSRLASRVICMKVSLFRNRVSFVLLPLNRSPLLWGTGIVWVRLLEWFVLDGRPGRATANPKFFLRNAEECQ